MRDRELVPTVVERQHPAPVTRLFELPDVARQRHFPTAPSRADDLHVHAGRRADLRRRDDLAQLHQRRIEHVVLEHPNGRARLCGRGQHPVGVLEAARQRLLDLDVDAGRQDARRDVAVQRRGHEDVDHVRLGGEHVVDLVRHEGLREHGAPPFESRVVEVAQGDEFHVVPSCVRRQTQLRDLPQPDDTDAHRRSLAASTERREFC